MTRRPTDLDGLRHALGVGDTQRRDHAVTEPFGHPFDRILGGGGPAGLFVDNTTGTFNTGGSAVFVPQTGAPFSTSTRRSSRASPR